VDTEKFISLIIKEPFDYTEWQSTLWNKQTVEQVSKKAMLYGKQNKTP
jgi:hypothetical protein